MQVFSPVQPLTLNNSSSKDKDSRLYESTVRSAGSLTPNGRLILMKQ